MESREIKINMFGKIIRLKSEEPEEYLQSIADYVEEKANEPLKNLDPTASRTPLQTRLLYASLNITDELFKLMQELNSVKLELYKTKQELQEFIEIFDSKNLENESYRRKNE